MSPEKNRPPTMQEEEEQKREEFFFEEGPELPSTYDHSSTALAPVQMESSDWIAVILAVIPGLGQILLGQRVKGITVLLVSLLLCAGGGLLSILSILDAYLVAIARKRRPLEEWEFFPDFQKTFGSSN